MRHYKSWSDLNKKLQALLCEELNGRVSYFLTRYHKVHNSYGRASVMLDGKEIVRFDWINMYNRERDYYIEWKKSGKTFEAFDKALPPSLKEKWDENCIYSETDFLSDAADYINMPVKDALASDNYIIKMLAVLDRRVGKRTLKRIADSPEYASYPQWIKQLFELRNIVEK